MGCTNGIADDQDLSAGFPEGKEHPFAPTECLPRR